MQVQSPGAESTEFFANSSYLFGNFNLTYNFCFLLYASYHSASIIIIIIIIIINNNNSSHHPALRSNHGHFGQDIRDTHD
jgi:hypothetical protein